MLVTGTFKKFFDILYSYILTSAFYKILAPNEIILFAYYVISQNELLGADIDDIRLSSEDGGLQRTPHKRRLFHYQSPSREPQDHGYSLSPVSRKSQKLLTSPKKSLRKIPRLPYKVLDAPELQDDFYLNLVDGSYSNVLTVGLSASVYLWSACTSQVSLTISLETCFKFFLICSHHW